MKKFILISSFLITFKFVHGSKLNPILNNFCTVTLMANDKSCQEQLRDEFRVFINGIRYIETTFNPVECEYDFNWQMYELQSFVFYYGYNVCGENVACMLELSIFYQTMSLMYEMQFINCVNGYNIV